MNSFWGFKMLDSLRKKHRYRDFDLWPAVYKKDLQELPGKIIQQKKPR